MALWPYFEEKARINAALEAQKARIQTLEQQVGDAKAKYSAALRNLERISDEIHRHRSRRQSTRTEVNHASTKTIDTDNTSDTNTSDEKIEELCVEHSCEDSVREWLRAVDEHSRSDNWTEIDLDYSSPEEVSFEKCSLRPRSASPKSPPPPRPMEASRVSAGSPRRIIRGTAGTLPNADRAASLRAELERGRRQSLEAVLHDTGEKVKEMFQGFSLFGERRGSESAPRTPRRAPSPRSAGEGSSTSDERFSDTDSLASSFYSSVEMLTDDQIASLMLDAQLEAVCDKLAGVGLRQQRSPQSPPETRY